MSSSKKPLSLFLVRLTPAIWAQFTGFYEKRELDYRPHPPPAGVWVSDQLLEDEGPLKGTPRLVAGCCMYPANGPFIIVEFVSTNPALPARLLHLAVQKICWAVAQYGAMSGQTPICFPMHKGVERMMAKAGYNYTKVRHVMYPPLFVPVHFEPGSESADRPTLPAPASIEAAQ